MSKTQLQTNNTRLASLIETLKGKAAGSGGSGSVETCTVSAPSGIEFGTNGAFFSNGTTVIVNDTTLVPSNSTITVAKNSILMLNTTSADYAALLAVSGYAAKIYQFGENILISVSGDCSIDVSDGPA